MADDLDPAIIKRTQESLGKYVKKPHLTEKLLKKPPFGFLHDVFRVVIRDTGFFTGLYTPEELVYDNIKDRDGKMKFLQKMIDVVKLTTNSTLAIRTSKIVAGHETDKTNELLQLMAEIIDKKLDWHPAVEQVLAGKTKEVDRKTKDSTSKTAKDSKTKDKTKEKESKLKDPKASKTSSKNSVANTNKDKEKSTTKLSLKEKTSSKVIKSTEKSVKKSSKEPSTKSKLTKTPSQTSSKSTPSPSLEKSKADNKPLTRDTECKHEEVVVQQTENKVSIPPPSESSINGISNEITKDNEVNNKNQEETSMSIISKEREHLSAGKSKKSSAKSRKSNASETEDTAKDNFSEKDNINSLEMTSNDSIWAPEQSESKHSSIKERKEETTERTALPQQEQKPKEYETMPEQMKDNTDKQLEMISSQPPTKNLISTPPPPAPVPAPVTAPVPAPVPTPINTNNEMKRENTFIRENSKESSSNQSSLVNRSRTTLRPPSARPPSARPGAPRRRDKNIEIILQPNDQIKMSGIQVKLETFGDLDDDGDNLVIIENPNANIEVAANEQQTNLTESEKVMQDETIEQGHLVQQILETQKELIQNDGSNQQKNDKDSTNGLVMRQTSARNMNNLRDVIQNLTKSINPLGKLMDFIPEDIDAMQLEYTMWKDTYNQAANELKREKSLTESATEPMKNQLIQIEANIAEYMEMIDASRVKILQNSEKILKMLTS